MISIIAVVYLHNNQGMHKDRGREFGHPVQDKTVLWSRIRNFFLDLDPELFVLDPDPERMKEQKGKHLFKISGLWILDWCTVGL